MTIFAIVEGYTYHSISGILKVSEEFIRLCISDLILKGSEGLIAKKSPGRPSKLTKTQKRELEKIIKEGPALAGFPGACWGSPMIQTLIEDKFGELYSVNYIAHLLKNMGFSYQKAIFVSDVKASSQRIGKITK